MSAGKNSSQLGWLSAVLAEKRARIAGLLHRVKGFGTTGAMQPNLFKKFLGFLAQVADEQQEERRIIDQIEAVEMRHRYNRAHNRLEHAEVDDETDAQLTDEEITEKRKRRKGLWRLFDLFS